VGAAIAVTSLAVSFVSSKSAKRSADEAKRANDYNEERDRSTRKANLEIQPDLFITFDQDRVILGFDVMNHGPAPASRIRAHFSHGDNELRDETGYSSELLELLDPGEIERFNVRFVVDDHYYMGPAEIGVSWSDSLQVENWIRVPCRLRGSHASGSYLITHLALPQYSKSDL
jgi:hypothetical protein